MQKRFIIVALLFINVLSLEAYKVGLLIVATGKYISFVPPLIASAEHYFCPGHEVTYFVFTDGTLPEHPHVVTIPQDKLGWPYDTLMRISFYHQHRALLQAMDYLFATDADMLFVDTVGDEILSERVATQHPGYVGRRGTYETDSHSTAYVALHEGEHYFAGGFNGGSREEFLKMARTITENIYKDLAHKIVAVWHDESHINRYFIDNPPTQILSPSYCYSMSLAATNGKPLPYPKRLIALDKNHAHFRN
jgi:histo-blood group ABO system transferase